MGDIFTTAAGISQQAPVPSGAKIPYSAITPARHAGGAGHEKEQTIVTEATRGIGDNVQTDFAAEETRRLEIDYQAHIDTTNALLDEARKLPSRIENDEDKARTASIIKRLRDHAKLLDGIHGNEKIPHLRRGQAVDQFFFALIDKVAKRVRTNKDGAADILQRRLTDYDTRVLEAERERRRKIAEEEARKAREAEEARKRAEREAEEARLAAERARKPETIETKKQLADVAETVARAAKVESTLAADKAEAAYVDTLAKPADIMRQRGEDGTLTTMARENYAEIEDSSLLDMAKLWPFISETEKEKALRAWARTTGWKIQMPGARIGSRPKSVVR